MARSYPAWSKKLLMINRRHRRREALMMKKNLITLIFLLVTILTSPCSGQEEDETGTFAITGYRVKGNTILDGAEMV